MIIWNSIRKMHYSITISLSCIVNLPIHDYLLALMAKKKKSYLILWFTFHHLLCVLIIIMFYLSLFLYFSYYLVIYLIVYLLQKKVSIWLLFEVIFTAVVVTIVLLVFHDYKRRAVVIGAISDVFNIMMYAAPLTIMVRTSFLHNMCT